MSQDNINEPEEDPENSEEADDDDTLDIFDNDIEPEDSEPKQSDDEDKNLDNEKEEIPPTISGSLPKITPQPPSKSSSNKPNITITKNKSPSNPPKVAAKPASPPVAKQTLSQKIKNKVQKTKVPQKSTPSNEDIAATNYSKRLEELKNELLTKEQHERSERKNENEEEEDDIHDKPDKLLIVTSTGRKFIAEDKDPFFSVLCRTCNRFIKHKTYHQCEEFTLLLRKIGCVCRERDNFVIVPTDDLVHISETTFIELREYETKFLEYLSNLLLNPIVDCKRLSDQQFNMIKQQSAKAAAARGNQGQDGEEESESSEETED